MSLPRRTKVFYASANVGSEALTRSRSLWLVYYYAPPADATLPSLLPGLGVGLLLAAATVTSSLNEVVIGYFSDRTSSRWGRRIPYVVLAAPFAALFAVLLFAAPGNAGAALTGAYLFLVLELGSIFSTAVGGPYEALLPELAPTSEERVSVQSLKVYLGLLGTALGLIGSDFLVRSVGYQAMALAMAGLALLFRYVGIVSVWSRAKRSRVPAEIGLREALRATVSNAPFRVLLPSVVLFGISFELLQGAIPFFAHSVLVKGSWVTSRVLLAVAIVSAVAFVPLFARLGNRTSKRHAYRASMLAAAVVFPLLGIAGLVPGIPKELQLLVASALIGAPIGAHFLFPIPLTADVIDDDSGKTKLRREATYLGTSSFVERTAGAFAPLILVLLRLLGDTRSNALGVRLVGPAAGIAVMAGYLLFRRFDLPDDVVARIPPQASGPPETAPALSVRG